ncbi:hypothetical protein EDC94DRAFT_645983 [Helicostylum pulchrum]|nr:hypothetical protein EDC94DRAFT_645983 [Helicostylum pulchrum]
MSVTLLRKFPILIYRDGCVMVIISVFESGDPSSILGATSFCFFVSVCSVHSFVLRCQLCTVRICFGYYFDKSFRLDDYIFFRSSRRLDPQLFSNLVLRVYLLQELGAILLINFLMMPQWSVLQIFLGKLENKDLRLDMQGITKSGYHNLQRPDYPHQFYNINVIKVSRAHDNENLREK